MRVFRNRPGLPPVLSLAIAALLIMPGRADIAPSKRDAEQLRRKIDAIGRQALTRRSRPHRTLVTESEVNSYLRLEAQERLPAGVVEPYIAIVGPGQLAGRAIVDLDAIRRQHRSTGFLDPVNLLTGQLPVSAAGVLRTKNGIGQFELQSAEVSGITIPKTLLQEMVSYYTQSSDHPRGVSLDDPFELPARIREIEVSKGQAVVIQ